jgi:hypothetical protein
MIALNNMLFALFDLGSSALCRGVGCGFGAFFGFPLVVHAESMAVS